MIGIVRVKQYRENAGLLNGSSSSSDTKLDLIYAFGTVFHFRVVLHSPYSEKKKSIYPETRKLETSLNVCWEDGKKSKGK